MNHELIFSAANTLALSSWIILILFGDSKVAHKIIHSGGVSTFLSIAYMIAVIFALASGAPGGFDSLESVSRLFESRDWLLAGWVHYLAFDLWVGSWISRKARSKNFHPLLAAPILILTFMLGPVGYLLFWCTSSVRKRLVAKNL